MIASEIKDFVRQQLMRLARWSTVAKTAANGWDEVTTQARGLGEPQGQDPARRMQHYGFRSTPPAGSEVVILACSGSASQRVIVASELPGAGPQSQPSGDAEMYVADGYELWIRANGATVKIDKNGKVTADAAAGQDVVVNGGTTKVNRAGDPVTAGSAMAGWISAVTAALAALGRPVTAPTDFGVTAGGAAHFKA